ncbi:peptide-N-glycosidase F-related protein [Bizionia gelidisalsuginis]|nr:peptide-N-glycosidase F-related protein [Bizionia gelidisalsuginis]
MKGENLNENLKIKASENFEVSLDDLSFSAEVSLNKSSANAANKTVYVRFSPSETAVGPRGGTLTLKSNGAVTKSLSLSGAGVSIAPIITVSNTALSFDDTAVANASNPVELMVTGYNLVSDINLTITDDFEMSLDGTTYANTLQIGTATANEATIVYVRFTPSVTGNATGTLIISNTDADAVVVSLSGNSPAVIHNYQTFNQQRLAMGGGYDQSNTQTFNLHNDLTAIETVKMYVKLTCPTGGCDEWDVYANVKVKDPATGELYELGRYITPYWNDNSQLERGFEYDVTDFKSLLTGTTELRIRTECWNDKGYQVSVDFDYIEGTPDYPYYAVTPILSYDDWSSSGVPYGVAHNFDLDKTVSIPANAESTHLRTIISGWGHATPEDTGTGRGCAEWCYRTHSVKINGANTFDHYMGPMNCAANPVNNQSPGNWSADRAGWCPGMEVPTRLDVFGTSLAGNTFAFEYDYEDWTNDGENGNAYYATSIFVVVKSNTPINAPIVTN